MESPGVPFDISTVCRKTNQKQDDRNTFYPIDLVFGRLLKRPGFLSLFVGLLLSSSWTVGQLSVGNMYVNLLGNPLPGHLSSIL